LPVGWIDLLILRKNIMFFSYPTLRSYIVTCFIAICICDFSQEWPTMGYATWEYSRDGYSLRNFKINVTNNSEYTIKRVKYKFWIYDELYYSYDVYTTITSNLNIGPFSYGKTQALPIPKKRYLHYYKSFENMSWGCQILDVVFYKTPEQIMEENRLAEIQRREEEQRIIEEAEKERLRLEKLARDRKRDSLHEIGLRLYNKNQLWEAKGYFNQALTIEPGYAPSLKIYQEISKFFDLRSGVGYKYRNENPEDFNAFILQLKNLVNEEMLGSSKGNLRLKILMKFDTLGQNLSFLQNESNPSFDQKVTDLLSKGALNPVIKFGYYLNCYDEIDLRFSWDSESEYIVSNAKGINSQGPNFQKNPNLFKGFISNLKYKYGNFTFLVKNKSLIVEGKESVGMDVSLVKYKINAGPLYAFGSLILPGWGSMKVSSGERGILVGLSYIASVGLAGLFKFSEWNDLSKLNEANYQAEYDAAFESANANRKLFLVSLGTASLIYVYDFSWSLIKGFGNIKRGREIKNKINKSPIIVVSSRI
jgi:hypothetical protein